eukprot:SAG31_NODE_15160_length_767_cov_1.272455_1_plen_180_part_10
MADDRMPVSRENSGSISGRSRSGRASARAGGRISRRSSLAGSDDARSRSRRDSFASSVRSSLESGAGFVTRLGMSQVEKEEYQKMKQKGTKEYIPTQIVSSIELQMTLYFNAYFSVVYFGVYLSTFFWKMDNAALPHSARIISPTIFSIWFISEAPRLVFGYVGNLKEKVPQLMSFWLLT